MADNVSTVPADHHGNVTSYQTEAYAAVWSGVLLVALVLCGVVPNVAILAAARCRRNMRTWRYALIYSLCVLNILVCVVWLPLNFGVVLLTYLEQSVHYAACYVHVTLLHFCAAALVSTAIFLAIQRLSTIWSEAHEKHTSNVFIVTAILLSWVVGGLCALYVGVHHAHTYSYAVCTQAAVVEPLGQHWAETVLCVIYIAALLSTLVIFVTLSACRQQALNTHWKSQNCNYQGIPSAAREDDRALQSISQQSPTKSSLRENSDTKNSSRTLASISKKVCLQEPTADDIHNISDVDDDDDDDEFDLKMRMKLAKRASGRRHTVANIGLSEAGLRGRRGSMDDARGGHPTNYQYVRKWSVDIVALQDQLENPKIHQVPFKELVELHDKKQRENKAAQNEDKTETETKPTESDTNDVKDNGVKAKDNDVKTKDLKVIKEQVSEEGDSPALCAQDPVSTSSIEVPAITIQHSNHSNPEEVIVHTYEAGDDEDQRARLAQQMAGVWRSLALLVVPAGCLLPLTIMLLASDGSVTLKYVLSSLVAVQCPLAPLLLAWVDASVGDALRRLHTKIAGLRCVCYCHIGKRRRCFGPRDYT